MAKEEIGQVKIEQEVLSAIAATAAGKVPGVARVIPGFVGGIKELVGKKAPQHAVKIWFKEEGVFFELTLEVDYGVEIPQLAWEVQKAVKSAVEQMTGMKVVRVDVDVRGLRSL